MVLDSAYLKATVGDALADGIAQAVTQFPSDPIEFLGEYLLHHADAVAKAKADAAEAERAQKAAALHVEAAKLKAHNEQKKLTATEATHVSEASALEALMLAAQADNAVFGAVLGFIKSRLGANCYIALADRPERVLPPPAEAPAAEASATAEEGVLPAWSKTKSCYLFKKIA
ncbi:hypothetical protein T492DRAFT_835509 [Pavlovales sp. CCMP2436]|nr:hypothetical protein T492DRAFT_835509 [Pavlovales sp. CCMP2436]